MSKPAIAVVGAGAWGTALAQMLASDGRPVLLWAREPEVVEAIDGERRNTFYLPDVELAESVQATTDLSAVAGCDIALMVNPAQHLGTVLSAMPKHPRDLVLCAKGIDAANGLLLHEIAGTTAPESEIAVLSGPTFAHEVAAGLPTAITLACGGGEAQWARLSPAIARPNFRPYYSDDLTGAEIGGAVKNVLAIACGVVDGLGLGLNARAALIARGYAEMLRFGEALGGRAETLAGLCGLGDLVLTCSSPNSRNFSLGRSLAEGADPAALMSDRRTVAEGAHTAPILCRLASERGVSMPIADAVERLLNGAPAQEVVLGLLARPLTAETPAAETPTA